MQTEPPLDTSNPFTYAEGRAAGISRRRLNGPNFFRVVPGVYVGSEAPLTHLALIRAALKHAPNGVVSGRSAAKLWNAVVPDSADVELMLPRAVRVVARGIREHRPPTRPPTTWRFGVRVTTPEATFVRLAAELDLVDLVVAGDALVRNAEISPADLVAAATAARTRRSRLARRAAALVREGVDSPRESKLRLLMVLAGMPEPEVNIVFYKEDGSWEFRLDLGRRDKKVAFEYDGRQHETPEHTAYDDWRKSVLGERDWRVHSFVNADLYVSTDLTVQRLREIHDDLGIPHTPSLEWQRHFPVRRKVA
ncbi:MAG: hypothetical protein ABI131_11445 [Nostocoides sp.]